MFRSGNKKKEKEASASITVGGISPKISAKLGTDGADVELGGTKTMTSTIQGSSDIKMPTALRGDFDIKGGSGGGSYSSSSYSASSGGGTGGGGGGTGGYSYTSSQSGGGGTGGSIGTGGNTGTGKYASYSSQSSGGGGTGGSTGTDSGTGTGKYASYSSSQSSGGGSGGLSGNISTSGTGGNLSGGLNGSGQGANINVRLGGSGVGSISKSIGGGLNGNLDVNNGRDSPSGRISRSSNISASSPNINDDTLRPMSPQTRLICLSRIDEKNALVTLNDRLATILARNRQLENENQLLNIQLREGENRLKQLSTQISEQYEQENENLRRRLDLAEKDKVKLTLDLRKKELEFNDSLNKIRKLEDEIAQLTKQITDLENRIQTLEIEIRKLRDDAVKNKKLIDQLTTEKYMCERQLKQLQGDHEKEVLSKVELENQLRNKGDELQMKVQVHQQQYTEMLANRSVEADTVGIKLQAEYENRLALAIRQLRLDCEAQVQANRDEQEGLYAKREAALRGEMERMSASLSSKGGDLSSIQSKLMALEKRLSGLDSENAMLQKSLADMENSWAADKAGFSAERLRLEGIIGDMSAERAQLIADYQGLLEIKVALVNEIATYRTLLDGEEERLDFLIQAGEEMMQKQMEDQVQMENEIKSHQLQASTGRVITTTSVSSKYESRL